MKARKFIDLLKDDEDIKKIEEESKKFEHEFVNILYYAKEKYGLVITELASFFNVRRQTIYNYFKSKSNDLPEHVKEKIQMVYGVLTFNEVLDLERKVELHTQNVLPTLEVVSETEESIAQVPENYLEVYDFERIPLGFFAAVLRPEFRFERFWKTAIHDKLSHEKLVYFRKQDEQLGSELSGRLASLKKKHGEEYCKLMLKLIDKNVSAEDEDFLMHIMDYKKE